MGLSRLVVSLALPILALGASRRADAVDSPPVQTPPSSIPAPAPSAPGFRGELSFTPAEITMHRDRLAPFLKEAVACLQGDLAHHQAFYHKWAISPFYGSRTSFGSFSRKQKMAALKHYGVSADLVDELQSTSCVGMATKCLGRAFSSIDMSESWTKLETFVVANARSGNALQEGLRRLGWRILYWNPDVAQSAAWDAEGGNGHHVVRLRTVRQKGTYYFNQVDDATMLVDFKDRLPAAFARIPFFIGSAHTGAHVFPGTFGCVIEAHGLQSFSYAKMVEAHTFAPLLWQYKSGLVAVPPGDGLVASEGIPPFSCPAAEPPLEGSTGCSH